MWTSSFLCNTALNRIQYNFNFLQNIVNWESVIFNLYSSLKFHRWGQSVFLHLHTTLFVIGLFWIVTHYFTDSYISTRCAESKPTVLDEIFTHLAQFWRTVPHTWLLFNFLLNNWHLPCNWISFFSRRNEWQSQYWLMIFRSILYRRLDLFTHTVCTIFLGLKRVEKIVGERYRES